MHMQVVEINVISFLVEFQLFFSYLNTKAKPTVEVCFGSLIRIRIEFVYSDSEVSVHS